jgi:hypothetical protein
MHSKSQNRAEASAAASRTLLDLQIRMAIGRPSPELRDYARFTTSGAAIARAMPPIHGVKVQQAIVASGCLLGLIR